MQQMRPHTLDLVRVAVREAQNKFLVRHPAFVAQTEIRVAMDGKNGLVVTAPVCLAWEKDEYDRKEVENEKILQGLIAENQRLAADRRKRLVHMNARLRKLVRKHEDRIPMATKRVWNTMSDEQRYAILKDIDYDARHKK